MITECCDHGVSTNLWVQFLVGNKELTNSGIVRVKQKAQKKHRKQHEDHSSAYCDFILTLCLSFMHNIERWNIVGWKIQSQGVTKYPYCRFLLTVSFLSRNKDLISNKLGFLGGRGSWFHSVLAWGKPMLCLNSGKWELCKNGRNNFSCSQCQDVLIVVAKDGTDTVSSSFAGPCPEAGDTGKWRHPKYAQCMFGEYLRDSLSLGI